MPKITQLPALTIPNNNDPLAIVDNAGVITKKITRSDLLKGAPLPPDTVDKQAIKVKSVSGDKLDIGSTNYKGYRSTNQTTTSTSWQSITGLGTVSGSLEITTTSGNIMFAMSCSGGTSTGNSEFGFQINGVDYEIMTFGGGQQLRTGYRKVSGLPAGTYTITPRFKSSGGGTHTIYAFNDISIAAWEV